MRNPAAYWAAALFAAAGLLAAPCRASEPMSATGDVGNTSYTALPFQKQVYDLCFNCSPDLEPAELFFQANQKSPFNDPAKMAQTHEDVAAKEKAGVIPSAGIQRWESTFAASFPKGTYPGEPDWVDADREKGLAQMPEFTAWRDWVAGHPQYLDMAADGGAMPVAFRAWGGSWGHISPLTPLDVKDCPQDARTGCDWGDAYAYRWAQSSAKAGAYGLILSDFTDSQPGFASNTHDFNPRIVAAFVAAGTPYDDGVSFSSPLPDQANWIVSTQYNRWNDFIAAGYAKFYAALIARVGAATGKKALIVDQCGLTPAARRLFGTDARITAQKLPPQNYLCMWDDHVTQVDRAGPIESPPVQELAGFVLAAAREPLIRNGANLEADDEAYRAAIAKFYPALSAQDQREVGDRLLKRLWIWSAWAHIADRSGKVRRAIAFASRDYWDGGSLAALDPLAKVLRSTVPARPFGPALYYSVAVERAVEQAAAKKVGTRDEEIPAYLPAVDLRELIDGGAPVGYYVSDAALGAIGKDHVRNNAPSAWIVPDADGLLPPAEQSALQAVAPVATSAEALAALPNQPLKLPKGLSGFGFYDADGALILVIGNPDTRPDAKSVSGMVQLANLEVADGGHQLRNKLTGTSQQIAVSGHTAAFPVDVPRWDTIILSLGQS
jgi:hypothetical protein